MGCQTLADLRKVITCPASVSASSNDISSEEDVLNDTMSEDVESNDGDKDVFFFIEGNIYVDNINSPPPSALRTQAWINNTITTGQSSQNSNNNTSNYFSPSPEDYSSTSSTSTSAIGSNVTGTPVNVRFNSSSIIPRETNIKSGSNNSYVSQTESDFNFKCNIISMSKYQLKDMLVRVGVRYLYAHMNGSCEHYLYFSDIRLYNSAVDEGVTDAYPVLHIQSYNCMRRCCVCEVWSAKFVVYGDRLAESNPSFLCQHCYQMLHYDEKGKLIYSDFTVFPYVHDMK